MEGDVHLQPIWDGLDLDMYMVWYHNMIQFFDGMFQSDRNDPLLSFEHCV
jgi:hypothetical protein